MDAEEAVRLRGQHHRESRSKPASTLAGRLRPISKQNRKTPEQQALLLVETQLRDEFMQEGLVNGELVLQHLAFGRLEVSITEALSKGCDAVFPLRAKTPHRYVALPFIHAQESTTGYSSSQ